MREQRWVLAVDVRPGATAPRTATAADDGVQAHPLDAADMPEVARAEAAGRGRVPPLAVVVVHPATWDDDRAARAADEIGAALGSELGEDAEEWPWPVPLNALEASAWRALEFGLLPARGRVAVVDPGTREAGVIDREYGRLAGVGVAQALSGPAGDEELVALARRVLEAAPAGPPFVGVLIGGAGAGEAGGAGRSGGTGLAAVAARVTGRPPLVPGDPATVALLGAASLGWAVATSSTDGPPVPRPRPPGGGQESAADAGGAAAPPSTGGRGAAGGAGAVRAGPAERTGLPRARPRRRLPRWALWLLPLAALAVVAAAAGLFLHGQRTTPSPIPYYTCPNGEVYPFSYECDRLAPQPSPPPSPLTYVCPNGVVVAYSYECDPVAPQPSAPPSTP